MRIPGAGALVIREAFRENFRHDFETRVINAAGSRRNCVRWRLKNKGLRGERRGVAVGARLGIGKARGAVGLDGRCFFGLGTGRGLEDAAFEASLIYGALFALGWGSRLLRLDLFLF